MEMLTRESSSFFAGACDGYPDCKPLNARGRKLVRAARRFFGLPPNGFTAAVTDMIAELKAASEEVLKTTVKHVAVSVPCQDPPWWEDRYVESVVEEALQQNLLARRPEHDDTAIIGDAKATQLSLGRDKCLPGWCDAASSESWPLAEEMDRSGVFYVR